MRETLHLHTCRRIGDFSFLRRWQLEEKVEFRQCPMLMEYDCFIIHTHSVIEVKRLFNLPNLPNTTPGESHGQSMETSGLLSWIESLESGESLERSAWGHVGQRRRTPPCPLVLFSNSTRLEEVLYIFSNFINFPFLL